MSSREYRWVKRALALARSSSHPKHRLGAVVVRGGAFVAGAANSRHLGRCAERRALRPHQDLAGATLYVARIGGRCSKPCEDCRLAIKEAGIAAVYYVEDDGSLSSLQLTESQ